MKETIDKIKIFLQLTQLWFIFFGFLFVGGLMFYGRNVEPRVENAREMRLGDNPAWFSINRVINFTTNSSTIVPLYIQTVGPSRTVSEISIDVNAVSLGTRGASGVSGNFTGIITDQCHGGYNCSVKQIAFRPLVPDVLPYFGNVTVPDLSCVEAQNCLANGNVPYCGSDGPKCQDMCLYIEQWDIPSDCLNRSFLDPRSVSVEKFGECIPFAGEYAIFIPTYNSEIVLNRYSDPFCTQSNFSYGFTAGCTTFVLGYYLNYVNCNNKCGKGYGCPFGKVIPECDLAGECLLQDKTPSCLNGGTCLDSNSCGDDKYGCYITPRGAYAPNLACPSSVNCINNGYTPACNDENGMCEDLCFVSFNSNQLSTFGQMYQCFKFENVYIKGYPYGGLEVLIMVFNDPMCTNQIGEHVVPYTLNMNIPEVPTASFTVIPCAETCNTQFGCGLFNTTLSGCPDTEACLDSGAVPVCTPTPECTCCQPVEALDLNNDLVFVTIPVDTCDQTKVCLTAQLGPTCINGDIICKEICVAEYYREDDSIDIQTASNEGILGKCIYSYYQGGYIKWDLVGNQMLRTLYLDSICETIDERVVLPIDYYNPDNGYGITVGPCDHINELYSPYCNPTDLVVFGWDFAEVVDPNSVADTGCDAPVCVGVRNKMILTCTDLLVGVSNYDGTGSALLNCFQDRDATDDSFIVNPYECFLFKDFDRYARVVPAGLSNYGFILYEYTDAMCTNILQTTFFTQPDACLGGGEQRIFIGASNEIEEIFGCGQDGYGCHKVWAHLPPGAPDIWNTFVVPRTSCPATQACIGGGGSCKCQLDLPDAPQRYPGLCVADGLYTWIDSYSAEGACPNPIEQIALLDIRTPLWKISQCITIEPQLRLFVYDYVFPFSTLNTGNFTSFIMWDTFGVFVLVQLFKDTSCSIPYDNQWGYATFSELCFPPDYSLFEDQNVLRPPVSFDIACGWNGYGCPSQPGCVGFANCNPQYSCPATQACLSAPFTLPIGNYLVQCVSDVVALANQYGIGQCFSLPLPLEGQDYIEINNTTIPVSLIEKDRSSNNVIIERMQKFMYWINDIDINQDELMFGNQTTPWYWNTSSTWRDTEIYPLPNGNDLYCVTIINTTCYWEYYNGTIIINNCTRPEYSNSTTNATTHTTSQSNGGSTSSTSMDSESTGESTSRSSSTDTESSGNSISTESTGSTGSTGSTIWSIISSILSSSDESTLSTPTPVASTSSLLDGLHGIEKRALPDECVIGFALLNPQSTVNPLNISDGAILYLPLSDVIYGLVTNFNIDGEAPFEYYSPNDPFFDPPVFNVNEGLYFEVSVDCPPGVLVSGTFNLKFKQ